MEEKKDRIIDLQGVRYLEGKPMPFAFARKEGQKPKSNEELNELMEKPFMGALLDSALLVTSRFEGILIQLKDAGIIEKDKKDLRIFQLIILRKMLEAEIGTLKESKELSDEWKKFLEVFEKGFNIEHKEDKQ